MRVIPLALRRALGGGLLLLAGCTDPYLPPSISSPPSYLNVDGFINTQGISTITLSRTYAIAATTAPPAETKATVYVEEEAGTRYTLREGTKGTYASDNLALNPAKRYRLHLTTGAGKEYASDYVPVKTTPPIDTVAWTTNAAGLNLTVSAHDATRATQYYRWEYDETWEITSPYSPAVVYTGGQIRPITTLYPTTCWSTSHSTTVQLSKTTALTQDVVTNYPLRQLPGTAFQLFRKYSILVQQHALTKEEYDYWELLRKNTESIGTLFDPQPSQLTGNVHGLSAGFETALGYIGAHSLAQKRIFISRAQLPPTLRPLTGYESCLPPDTVRRGDENSFGFNHLLPIYAVYRAGSLLGYTASTPDCIDCRLRGTAVRPSFWR
jgi:hypothetical protein